MGNKVRWYLINAGTPYCNSEYRKRDKLTLFGGLSSIKVEIVISNSSQTPEVKFYV